MENNLISVNIGNNMQKRQKFRSCAIFVIFEYLSNSQILQLQQINKEFYNRYITQYLQKYVFLIENPQYFTIKQYFKNQSNLKNASCLKQKFGEIIKNKKRSYDQITPDEEDPIGILQTQIIQPLIKRVGDDGDAQTGFYQKNLSISHKITQNMLKTINFKKTIRKQLWKLVDHLYYDCEFCIVIGSKTSYLIDGPQQIIYKHNQKIYDQIDELWLSEQQFEEFHTNYI